MNVNIAEAKARLSELVKKAMVVEEVIISGDNKPLLRPVPFEQHRSFRLSSKASLWSRRMRHLGRMSCQGYGRQLYPVDHAIKPTLLYGVADKVRDARPSLMIIIESMPREPVSHPMVAAASRTLSSTICH
jgi:antitoxin (DNA-binding transcriptional repressor) of toxin-antitoxin stability system